MLSRGFPNRLRSFFFFFFSTRRTKTFSRATFAAGIVTTASFLCLVFVKFRAIVGLKAANDAARNGRTILDGTTTLLPLCFPKLQRFFVATSRQINPRNTAVLWRAGLPKRDSVCFTTGDKTRKFRLALNPLTRNFLRLGRSTIVSFLFY